MADTRYRHRRTSNPATPFPTPIEPGEIAVNTANRQIAVGDAGAATGTPLQLIALRFFSTQAAYVANDMVVQAGVVYRAKGTISPGAFNPTQWDMLTGAVDPQYVETAGDVMTGMLTLPATAPSSGNHATNKTYVDTRDNVALAAASAAQGTADAAATSANNRVLKAGDVMTGMLTLPVTAPSVGEHATNKTYVDSAIAAKASVVVSPTPPVGVPDNTLWFENDSGKLFLKYNDGTGATQWVEQVPNNSAAVSNDVSYLPQVLAVSEATQARKNIYAAPFDALAYSGMQINGSIDVLQQGGGEISVNGYQADGWLMSASGSLATRLGRTAEIPGVGGATITGFNYHLYLYATTAKASLTTTDQVRVSHYIEGWRSSRLRWGTASAVPLTIAFWSNHDYAGTYSVGIRNAPVTHSCVMSYTHSVAGVAQYNVLTFPACTLGAWDSSNGAGLDMSFVVGCGPTFTAPSTGSWISGNYFSAPGQVNGVAATDKFFRITGLTVLPGIEAPTAARSPLIMRPYDQELVTCQRYWRTFLPMGAGLAATTAEARFQIQHHGMRAAPTPTVSAAVTISNIGTSNYTQSSPHMTWISGGADGGEYNFGNFAGMSVAAALIFRAGAGVVRFDARL